MRRARPRTDMIFSIFLPPQAESGAQAAGGLVSVGPDLHPRQRHREGRVSRRLRRARPDLRRARHQPARRERARRRRRRYGISARARASTSMRPRSRGRRNYRMWTYVTEELPALVAAEFPVDMERQAITGHSMGGHGALTVALSHPGRFRSVSAFAPIVAPSQVPWGQKALRRLSRRGSRRLAQARCRRADRGRRARRRTARRRRRCGPVPRKGVAPRAARSSMRRGRHPADAAAPAGLRPQLLFHLDVHGRPSALACGETEQGIGNDAQPPRVRSTGGGDGRLARVGRHRPARRAQNGASGATSIPKASRRAIPIRSSVILWTRRPFDDGERARADRRGRRGRGLPPRRRACAGAGFGGVRLDDAACWSAASSPRTSTGTASPTPTGTAAASAARSPRPRPTIRGRSTSPSSAARTSTKASSTPIAG